MATLSSALSGSHVLRPKLKPYLLRSVPLGLLAIYLIGRSPDTRFVGIFLTIFLVLEAIALLTTSITLSLDGFSCRSLNRTTSHKWTDIARFVLVEQRVCLGLIPINRYLGWHYAAGYQTNRLLAAARWLTRPFKLADAMVKPVGFHIPTLVTAMNQFLDLSRNAAMAAEYAAKAQALAELPTILVSRRARQFGAPWFESRSWFGGCPRLGAIPWPRHKNGVPMAFVAQIDLAELAPLVPANPLPSTGSLAFFLGAQPVVYVPPESSRAFTEIPHDAVALDEVGYGGTGTCCWPGDLQGPKLFPFWPIDFTQLGVYPPIAATDDEEVELAEHARLAKQLAAIDQRFARREVLFDAKDAFAVLGDASLPGWWHSAIHFADCLRVAADLATPQRMKSVRASAVAAGSSNRIGCEDLESQVPEFNQFVAKVRHWTRDRDPWMRMESTDLNRLHYFIEQAQTQFADFTRWFTPRSYHELATVTLLALATAEDRAYATMPAAIRRLINERYLLPTEAWHQVFGDPIDIQGDAVCDNQGNCLLLRLTHDDMMHWSFGDNGVYQFFIPPDDLETRNWAAARMTFECH